MGRLGGHIAVVAGGTRATGRGIAVALGEEGATVYVTGRTTRHQRSPMNRPETIEDSAALVTTAGGRGIAVQVDHADPVQVAALFHRINTEQHGRLDILVNDIWGGDDLAEWGKPFWEHSLDNGLRLLRQATETHMITSWYAAPLMVTRKRGLIVEVTDGVGSAYRGSFFYDLAKVGVTRLAYAQAQELRAHGVTALAVTPGFLRSEAMLERFGVTEENWRDGVQRDPNFAVSETPLYIGRAVAALAADPNVSERSGRDFAVWTLAKEYGFTDRDGTQPDWGTHYAALLARQKEEGRSISLDSVETSRTY